MMRVFFLTALVGCRSPQMEYPPNTISGPAVSVQEADCVDGAAYFRVKPGASMHTVEECGGDICQSRGYTYSDIDRTLTSRCGDGARWVRLSSLYL